MNKINEFLKASDLMETSKWSYANQLRYLQDWMDAEGMTPTTLTVTDYQGFLKGKGWGNAQQRLSLTALKGYLRFLGIESPILEHTIPKKKRLPPRAYDHETLKRVLNTIDRSTRRGKRDFVLLLLLYDSGLRAAEICRLKISDVDLDACRLEVLTKGAIRERKVIGELVRDAIAEWLPERAKFSQNGTDTLLLSIGGTTPGKPIKSLGIIVKRLGADAGIVLSPHDLRRSFAVNNVKKGVPIPVIMKQGGWSNLATFMGYLDSLDSGDYEGYSLGDDLLGGE